MKNGGEFQTVELDILRIDIEDSVVKKLVVHHDRCVLRKRNV